MTTFAPLLQLAFWCDHTNGFLLVLFPAALLLMGIGLAMG